MSSGDPRGGALTCNETTDGFDALPVALVGPEGFETGFGNWSDVGGDGIDRARDSGGTTSSGTGSTVVHTAGTASGFCLYTELSTNGTGCSNKTVLM